jgi:hypothetical protein
MSSTTDPVTEPIPIDCARAINNALVDPIRYSHIYTVQDFEPKSFESNTFKLPESDNVYWTQFKINWLGPYTPQFNFGWIERDKKIRIDFPFPAKYNNGQWYTFPWPIPAFHYKKNSGFYIIVDYPEKAEGSFLQIEFLGFENLFEFDMNDVLLCDKDKHPIWRITSPYHDYMNYTVHAIDYAPPRGSIRIYLMDTYFAQALPSEHP